MKAGVIFGLVSVVAMVTLTPTAGAPAEARSRSKRVAISNFRKHFDIIGHRLIDEHHEYHDYSPHDYHDYYHDDHGHDYHDNYHYFGDYHKDDHDGGGYGHDEYKPKPKVIIIKKIVPLSTTTVPAG